MKVNRNGRPCPEWCVTDHDSKGGIDCESKDAKIPTRDPYRRFAGRVRADQAVYEQNPRVEAWLIDKDLEVASLSASSREEAERTATLLDVAANSTKAELRGLAASFRAISAQVWPPEPEKGDAEAEPEAS